MERGTETRAVTDVFRRPLRSLRVSLTDRCNLRCSYCMPEEDYIWLPREELLTFEEIAELVGLFTELGVNKVRLTGGEPLLRKDLPVLIQMLARNPRLEDLALTTNAVLLAEQAEALSRAGLHRITVSLDTLRRDRFRALTRRDAHAQVLRGVEAAARAGFRKLKIDSVVIRGVNDDELADLLEYANHVGARLPARPAGGPDGQAPCRDGTGQVEVRFIEYMDVGGATRWSLDKVVARAEILETLRRRYGTIEQVVEDSPAPAERFLLRDGTTFGIIASTTAPFCRRCDRSRLTADGVWYLCLYAQQGLDLRKPLRGGASREEIRSLIVSRWSERADRGAEQRKELSHRGIFVPLEQLRKDPHLEMHTRGG